MAHTHPYLLTPHSIASANKNCLSGMGCMGIRIIVRTIQGNSAQMPLWGWPRPDLRLSSAQLQFTLFLSLYIKNTSPRNFLYIHLWLKACLWRAQHGPTAVRCGLRKPIWEWYSRKQALSAWLTMGTRWQC